VPVNDQHADAKDTVYVWLDALVNYLTVAGYTGNLPGPHWPPSVHVIGKDILKFHAVYWPAFLLALDLPLPEKLLVHSHWLVEDVKMSKSLGNVLCPLELMDSYGTDGTRYMLLREGVPHMDGNFSKSKMVHNLNLELADTLGNLLNRTCSTGVNPTQQVPAWSHQYQLFHTETSKSLIQHLENLSSLVDNCYDNFNFYQGIVHVMDTLRITNQFVQEEKPWELKKTDTERLQFVLCLALEALRISGILLQPIIPNLANVLLTKLNIPKETRTFEHTKEFTWYSNCGPRNLDKSKLYCLRR